MKTALSGRLNAGQLARLLRLAPAIDPDGPEAEQQWQRERAAQHRLETYYERFPERNQRLGEHMQSLMHKAGVTGGRVLEIGARKNSYAEWFPGSEYLMLDLAETGPGVIQGDITNCPELPSESFDVIISVDVFEHIKQPWLAAPEIIRLLRPGGFTYHSTTFSWRYHPTPADYWRYTPDSLQLLFGDLRTMRAEFDTVERRRNLIGRGSNRIDPDAFGGWRENWRVFYAGVKRDPAAEQTVTVGPGTSQADGAARSSAPAPTSAALDSAEQADDILDGEEETS